ncbi:hypothetical protein AB0L63_03735 [Nocardia sp. NPDC051990]|uniref:PD-(D/E)XK nuclease domain-containing protein n=1 Tax=Nocardia sp. NPDC051990 TaxID=3155285 RepID=UPI00343A4625
MNGAGAAKRITALLDQIDELATFGTVTQGEDESDAELAIRQLQDRYPLWYSASLSSLPDDLRGRFIEQFEARYPTVSPRIKQFIAHPRKPWALYDSVPRFLKGHGRWQYSLKDSYKEPLLEQRRLLLEAKARFAINPEVQHTAEQLTELFRRLPAALTILEREHRHRPGLTVADEYDLQKVLHALLRLHFDDVEPEETTPRRAGGSYRIDFVLRQEQVAIEAKMTRESLGAKEIRSQLVDDMFGYRGQKNVAALVVVVYDPTRRIDNPAGFEHDLNTDDPELLVRIVVAQG